MNNRFTIMKKSCILLTLLLIGFAAHSQNKDLQAQFNLAKFFAPESGPYLETYLTVMGNSAVFKKNQNNKFQASIQVTYLFYQNGELADFRKFNLLSPELDHDSLSRPNFIDIQRISLPLGIYEFDLKIKDNNSETEPFKFNSELDMQFETENIFMSDIQMLESYKTTTEENVLSKSGYDMVPYVSSFYPQNTQELIFYTEIYNAKQILGDQGAYLVSYYIESFETQKRMHKFTGFAKLPVSEIGTVLRMIKIEGLPSGNYNLVVEVRNRENKLLGDRRFFFQRSNPGVFLNMNDIATIDVNTTFISKTTNNDTLVEYLRYLYPISSSTEMRFVENLLRQPKQERMQQFFVNFWETRNPSDPEKAWLAYKKQVELVNRSFSSQIKKGYETDKGRVFLQYGAPQHIREEKHSGQYYPFEIWQYYELNGQANRKFLFYNPSIVGNEYNLLHSNARGEFFNQGWKKTLEAKYTESYTHLQSDSEDTEIDVDDSWGIDPQDIWDNP